MLAKIVGKLVLPPGINIILGLTGLALLRRARTCGVTLVVLALLGLYVMSIPWTAWWLNARLESLEPVDNAALAERVDAIVILGGGVYRQAPEYGHDTVSARALPRIRYGAYLHRQSGLPVLVTGGNVLRDGPSEAEMMAGILRKEWQVPVEWVEDQSRNTAENAALSAALLATAGIERVALVTHARHMPRALRVFERTGLVVVPAPVEFGSREPPALSVRFVPTASTLHYTEEALHEFIGAIWYRLRY